MAHFHYSYWNYDFSEHSKLENAIFIGTSVLGLGVLVGYAIYGFTDYAKTKNNLSTAKATCSTSIANNSDNKLSGFSLEGVDFMDSENYFLKVTGTATKVDNTHIDFCSLTYHVDEVTYYNLFNQIGNQSISSIETKKLTTFLKSLASVIDSAELVDTNIVEDLDVASAQKQILNITKPTIDNKNSMVSYGVQYITHNPNTNETRIKEILVSHPITDELITNPLKVYAKNTTKQNVQVLSNTKINVYDGDTFWQENDNQM